MNQNIVSKSSFAAALLAAYAVIYSGASAAHDDDRRPQNSSWQQHDSRHDDRHDRHDARDEQRYHVDRYRYPKGYQARRWNRGDTLPKAYRGSAYTVRDYQRYRLQAPPRDHRWVRVDNDVVLIKVSNGRVDRRIDNLFYY